jgi:uncharacterized membrane protein
MTSLKDNQKFSSGRIEALTDGVFAIAMTILVLDLKVGELGSATTNGQLLEAFKGMQANLASFVVSFLLLGSMWAVHVRQFEYIKLADRRLTMINTLRLLVVVFIPFTTSVTSAYSEIMLGRILLPLNFLLLAVVTTWQWHYASKPSNGLVEGLSDDEIERGVKRNNAVVVMALAVVIGSMLVGQWAFLIFALMPLIMNGFVAQVKNKPKKKSA